jgi:uncharacterized protein YndB with AHSA1/START domain
MANITCTVKLEFKAPKSKVWAALTKPEIIKQYFFGTNLVTDWKVGHPILWKGEWEGKAYEDKGTVLAFNPENNLKYTYFSSFSGDKDIPENYRRITYELKENNGVTELAIVQENCKSDEDKSHSEGNWKSVMEGMRKLVE